MATNITTPKQLASPVTGGWLLGWLIARTQGPLSRDRRSQAGTEVAQAPAKNDDRSSPEENLYACLRESDLSSRTSDSEREKDERHEDREKHVDDAFGRVVHRM
jgi:hypothetical protein